MEPVVGAGGRSRREYLVVACAAFCAYAWAATPEITLTPKQVSVHCWFFQGDSSAASAANRGFMSNAGFVVSERGAGYAWAENSYFYRLTPWFNDPLADPAGEALYVRDEEDGRVWSPTPLGARSEHPYLVRHGQGYSVFEQRHNNLDRPVLKLVVARPPEVENLSALVTPVPDRRPHQKLVGTQRLMLAPARASPEVAHSAVTRIDASGNALALGIPSSQQK